MTFSLRFVSSVEEFRQIFCQPQASTGEKQQESPAGRSSVLSSPSLRSDAFLLCFENNDAGFSVEGLEAFQQQTARAAEAYKTRLILHLWDCTSDYFAPAKAQLGKRKGLPLLAIIFRGNIADVFLDRPLGVLADEDVPRVCERLARYQRSQAPAWIDNEVLAAAADDERLKSFSNSSASVDKPAALVVDVSRILQTGQDLLLKGCAAYAEKCFAKALRTLEAVEMEIAANAARVELEDYENTVAICLAWAAMAQLVQGKSVLHNTYIDRLVGEGGTARAAALVATPGSICNRVCVLQKLLLACPVGWDGGAGCSESRLQSWLDANPSDHAVRAQLVITLFLRGDILWAFKEAVKLDTLGQDFGPVALRELSRFLGRDHALV